MHCRLKLVVDPFTSVPYGQQSFGNEPFNRLHFCEAPYRGKILYNLQTFWSNSRSHYRAAGDAELAIPPDVVQVSAFAVFGGPKCTLPDICSTFKKYLLRIPMATIALYFDSLPV